jgi:hypothetical protein
MDHFGRELLAGYVRAGSFGHREHLHMTWSYLRRGQAERVLPFLRHVAESHGETEKLNVTMTQFWLAATAHAIRQSGAGDFPQLLAREPHLLEQDLPFRHWSKEAIFSPAARAGWLDPDLKPLPF